MLDVRELVTGILYEDGEPEVRQRAEHQGAANGSSLFMITCDLSDEREYVATLAALFSSANASRDAAEDAARASLGKRIADMEGSMRSERVEWLDKPKDDLFQFVVRHLVRKGQARI